MYERRRSRSDMTVAYGARVNRRSFLRGAAGVTAASSMAALLAACGGGGDGTSGGTSPGGQQGGRVTRVGTVTIAMARDATTFDTLKSTDVYSAYIQAQTLDTLFLSDADLNIGGRLVEKAENPDNRTYVWTLQKGVKFQDGTELNAEAVKFNLDRHRTTQASPRYTDISDIEDIQVIDPATVKIVLKEPNAPFLSKLTIGAGYILSPTAVQRLGDNLQRELTGVGSGPYKFTEWRKDERVVVERNPEYWMKAPDGQPFPYIDRLIWRPYPDENVRLTNLRTGEVDVALGVPAKDVAALKQDPNITYAEAPGFGFSYIGCNTRKEPLNNKLLRQAVSYALDRELIQKTVYFGLGLPMDTAIQPVHTWAYDKDNHPYLKRDLAKARQLLQQAGRPQGFGFSFQISNASPQLQQVAELMKDQLREVGITMEIQLLEFASILDNANKGQVEAYGIGWTGGIDPDSNTYTLFHTSSAHHSRTGYSNPELDKLVTDARRTLSTEERGRLYKQAQRILLDELPFIIYYASQLEQTTTTKIQNYPLVVGTTRFFEMWKAA